MTTEKCDLCGVQLSQQYYQHNRFFYCKPCFLAGQRNATLETFEEALKEIAEHGDEGSRKRADAALAKAKGGAA